MIHCPVHFLILAIPNKTTKSRIENARIRLACRLARLTPSAVVTLFALCPGKHTGFHEIVEITTNSRFHVRNPRAAAVAVGFPPRRLEWQEGPGILDARDSLKFKCQSREDTSTHCRTKVARGAAERSGSEMNAECFSCLSQCRKRSSDRAHVCSRILLGGRGSQDPRLYLRPVHQCCFTATLNKQTRSWFRNRSLLVTPARVIYAT